MRLAARLVAALLLSAATTALPVAPAQAAACPSLDGVTVVVDYHELGGGVAQVCDAGGAGKTAAAQLTAAGFALTRVQRQPGFVCRVKGEPAEDPCVNTPPTDAYWGLWWSDGKSGSWTYSSQGVDALRVPEGGSVAMSWNGSATKSAPGVAPAVHASSPSPSPKPTPKPTKKPSPQPDSAQSGSTGPDSPGPSGSGPTSTTGATSPSATASDAASPSSSPTAAATKSDRARSRTANKTGDRNADKPGTQPDQGRATGKADRNQRDRDESVNDGSESPTASDAPATTTAAAPTSEAPSSGGDGMPPWVAPSAIGLLFAAAAATAVVRRRRGSAGT